MSIDDIPVRVVGPGNQSFGEADTLTYIDMPGDMARYVPPVMPTPDVVARTDGAREAMAWLRAALRDYRPGGGSQTANLSALSAECRELVNQILGEGEVGISCDGTVNARTQEAVLAGVWRTLLFDEQGRVTCDLLEVAGVPLIVSVASKQTGVIDTGPAGADEFPNALPILVELESRRAAYLESGAPHSINLTLLPLSDAELEFVDKRLGRGPIHVLSRAYGKCEVISTRSANVWWVRYYNSMGTLILNTLEVVGVPNVVGAAPEDLADSARRLDEILDPYRSEVA